MPGFLYYLPAVSIGVELSAVKKMGFGYAFDRALNRREVKGGPDGGDGVLLSDGRFPSEMLGYWPGKQTWRKIPLPPSAFPLPFVGYYTNQRPGPADLAREELIPGHSIELLDGNSWQVPMALAATDQGGATRLANQLPDALDLNDAGEWVHGKILPRYERIEKIADDWLADFLEAFHSSAENADGTYAVKFELKKEIFDAAVEVLSANYAIGRTEAAMLGLMTEAKAYDVLNKLIDMPGMVELQKKTEVRGTCGSSAGPAASIAATGRA